MTHHDLKLWPEYMLAKLRGVKPWEYRSIADRVFAVGDVVTFREWDQHRERYTGAVYGECLIIYVHELPNDHCIFTHDRPGVIV